MMPSSQLGGRRHSLSAINVRLQCRFFKQFANEGEARMTIQVSVTTVHDGTVQPSGLLGMFAALRPLQMWYVDRLGGSKLVTPKNVTQL